MKRYSFRREYPKKVLATWVGSSLDMDTLMGHFELYGKCEVEDWVTQGQHNKLTLAYHSDEACANACHPFVPHILQDESGKDIRVNVKIT